MTKKIKKFIELLQHLKPKFTGTGFVLACKCKKYECWENLKNLYIEILETPVNKIKSNEQAQPYMDEFQKIIKHCMINYYKTADIAELIN